MLSASSSMPANLSFFNVQRLLIQEKGEDIYYHLASLKRQGVHAEIADRMYRSSLGLQKDFFTRNEDKADYDISAANAKKE